MKSFNFLMTAALILCALPRPAYAGLTVEPGSKADSGVTYSPAGVPLIPLYIKKSNGKNVEVFRAKNISRMHIGREARLRSKPSEVFFERTPASTYQPAVARRSPPIFSISLMARSLKLEESHISPRRNLTDTPALSVLEPALTNEAAIKLTPVKDYTGDELNLLEALIFYELRSQKNISLALAYKLLESPQKSVQDQGRFLYALLLHDFDVESESQNQFTALLSHDPFWAKKAAAELIKNVREEDYEKSPEYENIQSKFSPQVADASQYHFNVARYQIEHDRFDLALSALQKIDPVSKVQNKGLGLKSVVLYRTGRLAEAIANQTQLLAELKSQKNSDGLKSQAALLLARFHFQNSDYTAAYQSYLEVDRKNSDWPEAQIESAWAQVLAKDYEGAAGNMFSLHTDFFKNTFAPESYVVRAVGYLNLCQYGDGLRVIDELNHRYNPALTKMKGFYDQHPNAPDYYQAVKAMLESPKEKEYQGLPKNLFFEIARSPRFKFYQGVINSIENEEGNLNQATLDLIDFERKRLKDKTINAGLTAALKKARTNLKDLRASLIPHVADIKQKLKLLAASAIRDEFQRTMVALRHSIDQTDALKYEIYAGAGQQMRYAASGGDVSAKDSEKTLAPKSDQAMQWKFKGEIWEDELGYYRSNLKNVCPKI